MDPSPACRREAERSMSIAEKLLMARDLKGYKQFVAEALSADPRAPGGDDIYAAADVLLAAQRRRLLSGAPDPYAVLGLDSVEWWCAPWLRPQRRLPRPVAMAIMLAFVAGNRSWPIVAECEGMLAFLERATRNLAAAAQLA